MKTNKTFAYGFLTVIIALAFIACPDEKTPESNPPVANAQAEPTHTLADNLTITLDGTDSTGNISAYAWECETYTADQGTVSAEYSKAQVNALITNANAETATVKPRKAGTYKFKLTVTGNDGESDTDTVSVVVKGYTVTTTLNINVNTFSGGAVGSALDFSPSYSSVSNTSDFTNAYIDSHLTYTIAVVNHDGSYTSTWNSTDSNFNGQILPRSEYGTDLATFTQTFYYDGQTVGSPRVLKAMVAGGRFEYFGDNYDDSGSLPAINGISLSRKITELP